MAKTFYVQNKKTRELLNQKGTWSRSMASYRLAEFDTEAEAESAFPQGVECRVIFGGKVDENLRKKPAEDAPAVALKIASADAPKAMSVDDSKGEPKAPSAAAPKFFLRKAKLFLDKNDEFTDRFMSENAVRFDTRDQALDKADALGVHLDDITVVSCLVRLNPPKLPAFPSSR